MGDLVYALLIAAIVLFGVLVVLWKLVVTISEGINVVGKFIDSFSGNMSSLTRAQKFNIFVDILALIWAYLAGRNLYGKSEYSLFAYVIALAVIVFCLVITSRQVS